MTWGAIHEASRENGSIVAENKMWRPDCCSHLPVTNDAFDWSHAANVSEAEYENKSKAGFDNDVAPDIINSNDNSDKSDNNVIYGSLLWEIQGRGWQNERCNGLGMKMQKTG